MKLTQRLRFVAVFLVGALIAGCTNSPERADLLVHNVTVYDGTGAPSIKADVAVRDGRFSVISAPESMVFDATETIDGSGLFLTPGLWDAHAHIRSTQDGGLELTDFLDHGVTSIHDLGGFTARLQAAVTAVATEPTAGPAIYPAYNMLNGESFGGFQRAVTTETEIVDAVAELADIGAARIKVHRAIAPGLLPIVIREAQKYGLPVTGHIPLGMSALAACEAGISGIEHVGSFVEAEMSVAPDEERGYEAVFAYLLSAAATPLYDCLKRNDIVVTPTIVIYPAIARRRAGGDDIPAEFIAFIRAVQDVTLKLYEHDVTLLAGTDTTDLPGFSSIPAGAAVLDELELLESAGIPASEIIPMATLNPARAIGVDDRVGSIAPGKAADFLLLAEDPGLATAHFRSLVAVYRAGTRHDPPRD